jgi:competence ComEA-like helix-hairpin-helix protein
MKKILFFLLLLFLFCPILIFAEQIDINYATLSQLDELTGIGPVYAQRIIDNRPFSSVDDLDRVKGIGPATLQKIKDQGLACVNCEQAYPSGVYINEILPNPEGADETEEWIELYNSDNFEVNLSGWQISDTNGTPASYIIPENTIINKNNYLVLKRPETKIMLNNDQDGLILLSPDKKIIDTVNFISSPLGQSYNKTADNWAWSTTISPKAKNIITAVAKKTSSTNLASNALPKDTKSDNTKIAEAGIAGISQSKNQDNNKIENPWFLFFTALAMALISALVVLFIKLKFQTNVRT